ncbi:MAG: hypothetical protein AAFU85_00615 [Planctomycetota bacterium]
MFGTRVQSSVGGAGMNGDARLGDDETDLFFRLFGDTDADRDFDGMDFGRFALAFLSTTGDPNYDPELDIEGDGDIDGRDYAAVGSRFLTTLPY